MDRLMDEIAPPCAITSISTPPMNPLLILCRGLLAISNISPLPSQRIPDLDRPIEVALPVRIKLYTERIKSANSHQSRFSAPK